jgi:hypothetical protein
MYRHTFLSISLTTALVVPRSFLRSVLYVYEALYEIGRHLSEPSVVTENRMVEPSLPGQHATDPRNNISSVMTFLTALKMSDDSADGNNDGNNATSR